MENREARRIRGAEDRFRFTKDGNTHFFDTEHTLIGAKIFSATCCALVERRRMTNRMSVPDLPARTRGLTHDVIGAAIEVHRQLGPGHLESVYERAFKIELDLREIPFESQVGYTTSYKGQVVGGSQLDLLVAHELIVELKAVNALHEIHRTQLLSYLRASGFHVGLLINFNTVVLKDSIRRVVWDPYEPKVPGSVSKK